MAKKRLIIAALSIVIAVALVGSVEADEAKSSYEVIKVDDFNKQLAKHVGPESNDFELVTDHSFLTFTEPLSFGEKSLFERFYHLSLNLMQVRQSLH